MRLREQRGSGGGGGGCTALIFRSGRVVMTGVHCAPGTAQQRLLATRIATRVCRAIHPHHHDHHPSPPPHRLHIQNRCRTPWSEAQPGGSPRFTVNQLRVRNLVGSRRLPYRIALHPLYQHLASLMTSNNSNTTTTTITVRRCVLNQISFPALRCTFTLPHQQQQQQTAAAAGNNNNNNNIYSSSTQQAANQQQQQQQCTALIFSTGRLIVTGLTEMTTLADGLNVIARICDQFHSPQQNY